MRAHEHSCALCEGSDVRSQGRAISRAQKILPLRATIAGYVLPASKCFYHTSDRSTRAMRLPVSVLDVPVSSRLLGKNTRPAYSNARPSCVPHALPTATIYAVARLTSQGLQPSPWLSKLPVLFSASIPPMSPNTRRRPMPHRLLHMTLHFQKARSAAALSLRLSVTSSFEQYAEIFPETPS